MDPMVSFTWSVEVIIRKMRARFTTYGRLRLNKTTQWSRETQWSIQGTDIQPVGLEKNSLLLRDPERKKTSLKLKLKCTTQISIFGLKCQTLTLEDIIILRAHSQIKLFSSFVESPTKQENISTQLKDTTTSVRNPGLWSTLIRNFSLRDKAVVLSKQTVKTFLSLVDSPVNFCETRTCSIQQPMNWPKLNKPQMRCSCSKCQQFTTLTPMQSILVTFSREN